MNRVTAPLRTPGRRVAGRRRRRGAGGSPRATTRPRLSTTPSSAIDSALRAFCSTSSTVRPVRVAAATHETHDLRRRPSGPGRATARPAAAPAAGPSARARSPASAARRPRAWPRFAAGARAAAGTARTSPRASRGRPARSPRQSAPSRRFSSTVSSPITPRPSGTCAMPRRTISSTGTADDVVSAQAHTPPPRSQQPRDGAQQRGLAGAVGPQDRGDATSADGERHAVESAYRRRMTRPGPRPPEWPPRQPWPGSAAAGAPLPPSSSAVTSPAAKPR